MDLASLRGLRPVLQVLGVLLSLLAATMLLPAAADYFDGNPDWQVFIAAAFLTGFVGGALALGNRTDIAEITLPQGFVLTTLAWVALSAFGALPFAFSGLGLSYTDGYFETMSGLTTSGSTVIVGLDDAPPGILLWRALLNGLGGLGIIVLAVAVLPMLRVGGMQLFRLESSDKSEKALPSATAISAGITKAYLLLATVGTLAFWLAGMSLFEAFCHALSALSTGGFSTSDASIGHFQSAAIEWIAIAQMAIGSLPFVLFLRVAQGRPEGLYGDQQVQGFFAFLAVASLALAAWFWLAVGQGAHEGIRNAVFMVVTLVSTTGFANADYTTWGSFPIVAALFLSFVGGCTGSTTGGIKIWRFQMLHRVVRAELKRLVTRHGVSRVSFNRRPVPDTVLDAVMAFFFLYALSFVVLAALLMLVGLDFESAISGSASAIGNIGPGIGPIIGPAGSYATLPDSAKWLLSFGMLLGRLELFTVLVLFTRNFWRA